MCSCVDLNMSVAYFTVTLLAAACLTQRAVGPLTREELRWLMTHIIFTLCRTEAGGFGSAQKWARCLAGGRQSRSNEAISELKCHKSDGRKTNWTHTLCIFHRSTWGLQDERAGWGWTEEGVWLFWRQRWSIVLFIRFGRNRWMQWCCGEIGAFSVLQLSTGFSSNVIVHFSASDKSSFSLSYLCLPQRWLFLSSEKDGGQSSIETCEGETNLD